MLKKVGDRHIPAGLGNAFAGQLIYDFRFWIYDFFCPVNWMKIYEIRNR